MAIDPRQKETIEAINVMWRGRKKPKDFRVINLTRGYFASRVDLGVVAKRAQKLVDSMAKSGATKQAIRTALIDQLAEWVQRVKWTTVKRGSHVIEVLFITKDDFGWYRYGFELDAPKVNRKAR